MKLTHGQARLLRLRRQGKLGQAGFLDMLLLYALVFVASELLRPKPKFENAKPAGLGDFSFPTATEGRSVPLVWGTVQIKGPNVVWYGDLFQVPIEEEIDTGLFSSETIIKGYKYFLGCQFALCRGPDVQLLRVWSGDDEVYSGTVSHNGTFTINEPELFGGDDLGSGGFSGTWRFFGGQLTQTPSTYLSQFQQVGPNNKTPGYSGTCYVVEDSEASYWGNSKSIRKMMWEVRRIPNGLGLSGGGSVNSGADANPINVIYEILTDTEWGLGVDPANIDTTNFTDVGNTLNTEGNGFSFLLDSPRQAEEIIELVEQQVDGVLFYNQAETKFQFKLARADYNPATITELNESNILKVSSFARGSWEDTTNVIRVQYNDPTDDYKQTYSLAQDSANIRIQDGVTVTGTKTYPGCKNATLANTLAWRDLRGLSYPLARLTVEVDQSFWNVQPADVFAYTSAKLSLTRLPMRVTRVDYGDPGDHVIKLDLVQDVFYFQTGSFGNPTGSGWTPPADTLVPFPGSEQMAIESPRALNARDPFGLGAADNRIWVSARKQGVEVLYRVWSKLSSSGTYVDQGQSFGFAKIGELQSALDTTGVEPTGSVVVVPTPDSQADIRSLFDSAPSLPQLGTNLLGLIYVGEEFMLVQDASDSGGNVTLTNVYRGVLDSTRGDHAAGTDVWCVVAGGFGVGSFGETETRDIKLAPRSATDEVAVGSAVNMQVIMDKRTRRPYPPGRFSVASGVWPSSVSLEVDGSGPETWGMDLEWYRRDYRTGDGGDEIAALLADATTLFGDFPTANTTLYTVEVWNDPDGTPTLLLSYPDLNANLQTTLRLEILKETGGVLPTRMRVKIRSKHNEGAETLTARYDLQHDFDVTSALTGDFEFGAVDTNVVSNIYTADGAGTHSFSLSSAFASGDVEYRLNSGSWVTLISAGGTAGSILSVAVSDTIEIRHTSPDVSALKQLTMTAPGTDGFAVLYT